MRMAIVEILGKFLCEVITKYVEYTIMYMRNYVYVQFCICERLDVCKRNSCTNSDKNHQISIK